jgi:hypothetical protein
MSLSAHLAELTHNQTYTNAAILAATFINNHLLDSSSLVAWSTLDSKSCSKSDGPWSYFNGATIEGLSILADVTKDDSWHNL